MNINMKVFDLHCDTISRIREERKMGKEVDLRSNNLHLDLEKMKKGGYGLQTFALYTDMKQEESCFEAGTEMVAIFKEEMEKNSDVIAQVRSFKELEENEKSGKMSAMLSLEEGVIYQDSIENLKQFYDAGARIATLTWNYENELAYPNRRGNPFTDKPWSFLEDNGLKQRGFEFLEAMEEMGMVLDVSHLSDGGFFDVADAAKKPFIATHSNARAIAPYAVRNLTDEMIREIGLRGGLIGLNYCVSFVRPGWTPGEDGASMEELAVHVEHIINKGGTEILGLGSDYDGIEEVPEMTDCSKMMRFAEYLLKRGMNLTEIERIFEGNVKRFLKENL